MATKKYAKALSKNKRPATKSKPKAKPKKKGY